MSLADYFENTKGMGVLATADNTGKVDAAVYARPHVQDETTVAFIMRDKLSYKNLCTNPSALYLFVEKGEGLCRQAAASDQTPPRVLPRSHRRSTPLPARPWACRRGAVLFGVLPHRSDSPACRGLAGFASL